MARSHFRCNGRKASVPVTAGRVTSIKLSWDRSTGKMIPQVVDVVTPGVWRLAPGAMSDPVRDEPKRRVRRSLFSEKLVRRCAVGARGGLSLTASG
jgi:hypothetical protein